MLPVYPNLKALLKATLEQSEVVWILVTGYDYKQDHRSIRVLDALAGCGIRSLRYWHQEGKAMLIIFGLVTHPHPFRLRAKALVQSCREEVQLTL